MEEKAEKNIEKALECLKDVPIAIDYQAVRKPFTLAKFLKQKGFNIKLIMTSEVKPFDKEAYNYILENYNDIEIINAIHHDMTKFRNELGNFLCIGFDCAYATGSKKILNIMEDKSLFGFYGVSKLMELMVKANEKEIDLHKAIEGEGLVI